MNTSDRALPPRYNGILFHMSSQLPVAAGMDWPDCVGIFHIIHTALSDSFTSSALGYVYLLWIPERVCTMWNNETIIWM